MRSFFLIIRLVALLVFAFCLPGLCLNASEAGRAWAAGLDEKGGRGSIAIGVHPLGGTGPVCFTLTDPLGRRMSAGPPCEAMELDEIPDAYQDYESIGDDETGAPGLVTRVIFVSRPMPGEYTLIVNLPEDDGYDLEAQSVDAAGAVSHSLIKGVPAAPDKTDEYVIVYPATGPDAALRTRRED